MKTAFIYAGQGSQKVGMGRDLYETYPTFRAAFDKVDPAGCYRELCFEGTLEKLSDTRNTQPCMVAFAISVTALLYEHELIPDMCCGLSLGEYSALAAAGVLDPVDAVRLVAFRGDAMASAAEGMETLMSAILGLDAASVERACIETRAEGAGVVEVANYNCPSQIVISGEKDAVLRAGELACEMGARRFLPLQVSGPFHTSLMEPAAHALRHRLRQTTFHGMRVPVVFNVTGEELSSVETVPRMLELQVMNSVRFQGSIENMWRQGIDSFVEIGPGRTLSRFVQKTCPDARIYSVEDCPSFAAFLDAVGM